MKKKVKKTVKISRITKSSKLSKKGKHIKAAKKSRSVKKRASRAKAPAEEVLGDKETLKYLKMAFDLEKSSLHFYMLERNRTRDFNMKAFLNTLLDSEMGHFASVGRVKRLYEHHKTAQLKKEAARFDAHKPENPFKAFKQWEKLGRQETGIYDIFKTAQLMEEKAHNFYLEAAKHSKGEFIKLYLQKLARDEWYHKQFIESHREAVYNNGYWLGIDHVRIES